MISVVGMTNYNRPPPRVLLKRSWILETDGRLAMSHLFQWNYSWNESFLGNNGCVNGGISFGISWSLTGTYDLMSRFLSVIFLWPSNLFQMVKSILELIGEGERDKYSLFTLKKYYLLENRYCLVAINVCMYVCIRENYNALYFFV